MAEKTSAKQLLQFSALPLACLIVAFLWLQRPDGREGDSNDKEQGQPRKDAHLYSAPGQGEATRLRERGEVPQGEQVAGPRVALRTSAERIGFSASRMAPDTYEGRQVAPEFAEPGGASHENELVRVLYRIVDATTGGPLHHAYVEILAKLEEDKLYQEFKQVLTGASAETWQESFLPEGRYDFLVFAFDEELEPLYGYSRIDGIWVVRDESPARLDFEIKIGLVLILELEVGTAPLPADHIVLFLEEDVYQDVSFCNKTNSWKGGMLGVRLFDRQVLFDRHGDSILRGLVPGRFRFKVFPDDIVIEPTEVVLEEGGTNVFTVRWSWL